MYPFQTLLQKQRMKYISLCGLLFLMVSGTRAAPTEDLITNLPGLTWKPNFKQYSGYLQASGTKKLHYWLAESEHKPQSAPVVVFFIGGPGCSSLFSFFAENGPFQVKSDGETLMKNPYSWNQIANMLYVEMPAGIGFSYSDDRNYTTDDDTTAKDNYLALRDFFQKFPEYQNNDFYITGVSYAGIYVPTLAMLVMEDSSFNFRGFGVGNGLLDWKLNYNSLMYYLEYHGVFAKEKWNKLWKYCCEGTKSGDVCDFQDAASRSEKCNSEFQAALQIPWTTGVNPYNLYSECYGGANFKLRYDSVTKKVVGSNLGDPFMSLTYEASRKGNLTDDPTVLPCINCKFITAYLNMPETRKALHIPSEVQAWTTCSTINYNMIYQTMRPQYLKAINSKRLRIFVYNGDVDMACNFLGDEWFVDDLNLKDPQPRRAWYYKAEDGTRQIAGYVKAFPRSNVTFLTIKGAGHFSDSDKPLQALIMLEHLLSGNPFN